MTRGSAAALLLLASACSATSPPPPATAPVPARDVVENAPATIDAGAATPVVADAGPTRDGGGAQSRYEAGVRAAEARNWGILRNTDRLVMHRTRVIEEAKQAVLTLAREGYRPPQPRQDVLVLGEPALTKFKLGMHMMKRGGYISDHDALIGTKIAYVMSGGNLTRPTKVSEQYLLDIEREAFVSLCGTKATQERLAHMLKTGKPLRN